METRSVNERSVQFHAYWDEILPLLYLMRLAVNPFRAVTYGRSNIRIGYDWRAEASEVRAWFFFRMADGGPPTPLGDGFLVFGLAWRQRSHARPIIPYLSFQCASRVGRLCSSVLSVLI
jgi:hypothetical protein